MELLTDSLRDIVADLSDVAQTERLTGLLMDVHTGSGRRNAVALIELLGVLIRLDGAVEVLSRTHRGVLHVVGPQVGRLSALGRVRDTGKAVPSDTIPIGALVTERVKNRVLCASLVETLASLVKLKNCHGFLLLIVEIIGVVIEIINDIVPI